MIKKYVKFKKKIYNLIPRFILSKIAVDENSICYFVKKISKELKSPQTILDAGAGDCPYKKFFKHVNYESTDYIDNKKHDFICDIQKIPKKPNTYDAILSTQVLEHVKEPKKVLQEFYRILKPNGKLFMTVPQGYGIHSAPENYFNFTKYGMKYLLEQSGFKIVYIKPRGGIFWHLMNTINVLPGEILTQYLQEKKYLVTMILFPFFIIFSIIAFIFCFIIFYLDFLDKTKNWTNGYSILAKKSKN